MLALVKRELKNYLKRKGWTAPSSFRGASALHLILLYALGIHKKLHIIQIGAYDGVTNDPLRPFIVANANDLDIILFEPQIEPFRKLHSLYQDFPNIRCVNKAIGAPGVMAFYSVNDRYKEWYRQKTGEEASTATNSFIKEHIAYRMKRMGVTDVENYIDRHELEVSELLKELEGTVSLNTRTDLLQVDCEGMDDEVIYHSGIDSLKPRMINFESKCLPPERLQKLKEYLIERRYEIAQSKRADTIAISMDQ